MKELNMYGQILYITAKEISVRNSTKQKGEQIADPIHIML
jgi:hypothetical protein